MEKNKDNKDKDDTRMTELTDLFQTLNLGLGNVEKTERDDGSFNPGGSTIAMPLVPISSGSISSYFHYPELMSGDARPITEQSSEPLFHRRIIQIATLVDSPPPEDKINQLKCFLEHLGFIVVYATHSNSQDYNECGYIAIVNAFDCSKQGLSFTAKESLHGQSQQVVAFFNFIVGKGNEAAQLSDRDIREIVSVYYFLDTIFDLKDFTYAHRMYSNIRKIHCEFEVLTLTANNPNSLRSSEYHMDLILLLLGEVADEAKEKRSSKLLRHLYKNMKAMCSKIQCYDQISSLEWKRLAGNFQTFRRGESRTPDWFGGIHSFKQFEAEVKRNIASDRTDENPGKVVYIVNTEEEPGQHWFTALTMSFSMFEPEQEYGPDTQ